MLFSSTSFIFFFLPLLLTIYFLTPKTWKNIILLLFSILFYLFSSVDFIRILLISIFLNFMIARYINVASNTYKKFWLIIGIALNLGVLFYFKYISFFVGGLLNPLVNFLNIPQLTIPATAIPLALSFYTFHALSFLIDVYQKKIEPGVKLTKLALYFFLFPHLIAGPIVRFGEISDQIDNRKLTLENFSYGALRFIVGLGKKVLIADILATTADEIFGIPPANMTTPTAWLGILTFTLQIYFDFSGYSDMAIGLASMLGFKFPENFNFPYISTSIGEFWQRWHMTLSRWFRDYVYIPLGGNRLSDSRIYLNIIIVFFLTGLWHGAGWHYIAWGLLQGFFIILERFKNGLLMNKLMLPVKYLYALLAIFISWVFFRSENIGYAILFLKRMFIDFSAPKLEYRPLDFLLNKEQILAIALGILISTSLLQRLTKRLWSLRVPFVYDSIRVAYLLLLLIISLFYIADQTYKPFIYFKF